MNEKMPEINNEMSAQEIVEANEAYDPALEEGKRKEGKRASKVATTTLAVLAATGAMQANEKVTATDDLKNLENKEISYNANATEEDIPTISYAEAKKLPGQEPDLETDPEKEPNPESAGDGDVLENLEVYEKVMDAGFAMGIADMNPERANEIKAEFSEFLSSLPQELKDKINNGEIEIIVEGSASKHPIVETGVDTGTRGKAFTNKQLAEFRAQEGVRVLSLSLEDAEGIERAEILPDTPENDGVYDGDDKQALEEGRMVKIKFRAAIEGNPDIDVDIESNLEDLTMTDLSNTSLVIIDKSPSMKAEAQKVREAVAKYNEEFEGEVKIVDLKADGQMGTIEDHYGTFLDELALVEKPYENTQTWHVWTDEYQNKKYDNFEQGFNDMLEKAKSLNIKIVLHAFEAGNTGNRTDVELTSADQIMGRNMGSDNTAIAYEKPEE